MVNAFFELLGALLDIALHRIHAVGHRLALFLFQLRLAVLEVVLFLQLVVLTLLLRDALDDVFDFFDETALDRLGELDLADQPRRLDLGAHHLPAGAAVLALVGARDGLELFVELFDIEARLAHAVDLLEELLRALLDLVFGDFLVVEDHQLANGALAGAQLIAHADHRLGNRRHARDRLDHRQLAALDAACNLDFAFAREQRHGAHLAQVHADGIVGLVERARREIELGAFAFGSFMALDTFTLELVALFRIDEIDAGAGEHGEELFEVLGVRGEVRGQQIVHFVVKEIALLLADDDQLPDFIKLIFERDGHIRISPRSSRALHCNSFGGFMASSARTMRCFRSSNAISGAPVSPIFCKRLSSRWTSASSRSRRTYFSATTHRSGKVAGGDASAATDARSSAS